MIYMYVYPWLSVDSMSNNYRRDTSVGVCSSHSPPHTLQSLFVSENNKSGHTQVRAELTQGIFQTQIGFIAEELSTICFNDLLYFAL